ncbi:nucleotidyltransferase family protein [Klebsiella grimontii]|uniref:nucleotidyltransferase family protein n=1 Tax=Klebsiella grimontii TaxID=2058152 RepID=UPI001F4D2EB3|nr:NTP transferase domain-containing protein [Klebsiella grimontii]MDT8622835.1 NTP transferase domain-containing protein [Klebsiella grimontii]UNF14774.1 NTP transferase domain-containing protein [Klebsiella grimontii]
MRKKVDKQCIMLAAGLSSRMGKWKMMLPWGKGTILDSALASALAFCDRVVLVTGFRGDELAACYQDHPGVEVVFNPQYQDGMFSSVQCGVSHIRDSRFFLALGDMPEVTPGVYRRLWDNPDAESCLIPAYERGKGHPVLLPQRAISLIHRAPQGATLRDVIGQMAVRVIPVVSQGIHWDVDTPQQYLEVARRCRKDQAAVG